MTPDTYIVRSNAVRRGLRHGLTAADLAVVLSAQAVWALDEASFRRVVRAFVRGVIDRERS